MVRGAALVVNDPAPNVNTAAMRISQGAGEFIPVVRTSNLAKALGELSHKAFQIRAADQNASGGWNPQQENVCFVMK